MHKHIDSLGIKVKKGDEIAMSELLKELEHNIARFAKDFLGNWKKVVIEDYEDLVNILKYEAIEACKGYDPQLGKLLPRIYDFWDQKKSKMINHYVRAKRNGTNYGYTSLYDIENTKDEVDCFEPILSSLFSSEICTNEKQRIAVSGIMAGKKLRQIARENPDVFKYHQDVKKTLDEVYRTYKAG